MSSVLRSPSLESGASLVIPAAESRIGKGMSSIMEEPSFRENLFDSAVAVIKCPEHKTFVLDKNRKGLFLPVTSVNFKQSYRKAMETKLKSILVSDKGMIGFTRLNDLQIARIQVPNAFKFVTRVVFHTELDTSKGLCCKDMPNLTWMTEEQLIQNVQSFSGVEAVVFPFHLNRRTTGVEQLKEQPITENNIGSGMTVSRLRELPVGRKYEVLLNQVRNIADQDLLSQAGYSMEDVVRIYSEYIQHVYPSIDMMTKTSLAKYLKESKLYPSDAFDDHGVFSAFSSNKIFVNFHDFLVGIIALDPKVKETSKVTETRKKLISRIKGSKKEESRFRGSVSFQGIASLNHSVMIYPDILSNFETRNTSSIPKPDVQCQVCKTQTLSFTPGYFVLGLEGIITQFRSHPDLAVSKDISNIVTNMIRVTKADDPAMTILRGIEDYADAKGVSRKMPRIRPNANPARVSLWQLPFVAKIVVSVLTSVIKVLKNDDSKVVSFYEPVQVFASSSGFLEQLILYEVSFFKKGINFECGAFVFMGNTSMSSASESSDLLECLLFLLANKSLCPHRVVLLKGSFEASPGSVLEKHVKKKFGDKESVQVLSLLNQVFSLLPVAVVVGNDVLISHRPPLSASNLNDINNMTEGSKLSNDIFSDMKPQEEAVSRMLDKLSLGTNIISGSSASFSDSVDFTISKNLRMIELYSSPRAPVMFIDAGKIRPAMLT